MGTFHIDFKVRRDEASPFQEVEGLVDTGATYTMLPSSLLNGLNVVPVKRSEFTMADGRKQWLGIGDIRVRIGQEERFSPVIFGPEERFLLGAVTLQIFGLAVDTTHEKLIPASEMTI